MAEKGWLARHATEAIITGIIALILPSLAYYFWDFLRIIPGWMATPVTTSRWLFWLLLGGSGFFVILLGFVIYDLREKGTARSYVQDEFFGVTWRWGWSSGGSIINITPYCLSCDRLLQGGHGSDEFDRKVYGLVCDHCGKPIVLDGDWDDLDNRVRTEIDLRLRHGIWKLPGPKTEK